MKKYLLVGIVFVILFASDMLKDQLQELVERIGPYPHACSTGGFADAWDLGWKNGYDEGLKRK